MAAAAPDLTDLTDLNATEREVLRLLATGHTAKSIATLTGRSEGAVNERLRDARRKTGVGSSRELARLLREREIRNDQIGVAPRQLGPADDGGLAGGRNRRFPKVFVMIVLLAATGALSLGISATLPSSQTAPSPDSLVDPLMASAGATPEALRRRFLAEPRDPAWAARSEAVLANAYRAIDGLAPDLRIRCASTLCEVAGHSATADQPALASTMQALQAKPLFDTLAAQGLYSPSASFGGPGRNSFAFVTYWSFARP